MKPTIGRIVNYKLTEADKKNLEAARGFTGRYNNTADTLPAIIVAVWSDTTINAQVFVDGHTSTMWKTSINQGDEIGQWNWPYIQNDIKTASTDKEIGQVPH